MSLGDKHRLTVQRRYTQEFMRSLARGFDRADAFELEMKEANFEKAELNYFFAFWRWVLKYASADFLKRFNNISILDVDLPADVVITSYHVEGQVQGASGRVSFKGKTVEEFIWNKCQYLVRRAVFLEGIKHGRERDRTWYMSFAVEFAIAESIGDAVMFDALAQTKDRRWTKREGSTHGDLSLAVLRGWLAGGLWRLRNDDERAEALEKLLQRPKNNPISEDGFKKARQRLKLRAP